MDIALLLMLVALLIGLSKGGLGGPVPVSMTAPLLSLVMPVQAAIGVTLPLLIFADVFALYFFWRKWDMRYIKLMLPMGLIGAVLGILLLSVLSDSALRRVLGAFTLVAVIYKVASDSGWLRKYKPQLWHGRLAGWGSGFASALANAGAPPFTAYMLLQDDITPMSFVGTTTLFFAIINAFKLPGFLLTGTLDVQRLISIVWIVPLIPVGVWLGRWLIHRINTEVFIRFMLGLLFLLGLWLLLR
jgi:uncharacterized membrane protein YfcA